MVLMGDSVHIIDVTLRDGLQNEPNFVSTRDKLALIERLVASGIKHIQATSFVHPKWVPQLADAEAVAAQLHRFPGVQFSALIPNLKGYERALAAGIRHLEFVIAASETFNRKNLNCSRAESLEVLKLLSSRAEKDGVVLRVGFSTCFHCPFEGRISASALLSIVRAAREIGAWRLAICDTDGMAFPDQVAEAVSVLKGELQLSADQLALHFHDTYGRALANSFAGLQEGVREFDASTAGLGGCPYCPGASGNVATEDLVAFLDGMGYASGANLEKLLDAAEFASRFSSRTYQGHLLRAKRSGARGAEATAAPAKL
jgi:hydroxymethylglutaryl-CoA lyase